MKTRELQCNCGRLIHTALSCGVPIPKHAEPKDAFAALQEDYALLLEDRDFMWKSASDGSVEEWLAGLTWTDQATDREKDLVIGNVRAFASHFRGIVSTRRRA